MSNSGSRNPQRTADPEQRRILRAVENPSGLVKANARRSVSAGVEIGKLVWRPVPICSEGTIACAPTHRNRPPIDSACAPAHAVTDPAGANHLARWMGVLPSAAGDLVERGVSRQSARIGRKSTSSAAIRRPLAPPRCFPGPMGNTRADDGPTRFSACMGLVYPQRSKPLPMGNEQKP